MTAKKERGVWTTAEILADVIDNNQIKIADDSSSIIVRDERKWVCANKIQELRKKYKNRHYINSSSKKMQEEIIKDFDEVFGTEK